MPFMSASPSSSAPTRSSSAASIQSPSFTRVHHCHTALNALLAASGAFSDSESSDDEYVSVRNKSGKLDPAFTVNSSAIKSSVKGQLSATAEIFTPEQIIYLDFSQLTRQPYHKSTQTVLHGLGFGPISTIPAYHNAPASATNVGLRHSLPVDNNITRAERIGTWHALDTPRPYSNRRTYTFWAPYLLVPASPRTSFPNNRSAKKWQKNLKHFLDRLPADAHLPRVQIVIRGGSAVVDRAGPLSPVRSTLAAAVKHLYQLTRTHPLAPEIFLKVRLHAHVECPLFECPRHLQAPFQLTVVVHDLSKGPDHSLFYFRQETLRLAPYLRQPWIGQMPPSDVAATRAFATWLSNAKRCIEVESLEVDIRPRHALTRGYSWGVEVDRQVGWEIEQIEVVEVVAEPELFSLDHGDHNDDDNDDGFKQEDQTQVVVDDHENDADDEKTASDNEVDIRVERF